jgi:hypothetical protein
MIWPPLATLEPSVTLAPKPEIDLGNAATSLDFLQAVYRDPTQPLHTRMRAAALALPFEHPKLAVVAQLRGEGFAAKLEAAMRRAGKSVVIDAKPAAAIERKHQSPSR